VSSLFYLRDVFYDKALFTAKATNSNKSVVCRISSHCNLYPQPPSRTRYPYIKRQLTTIPPRRNGSNSKNEKGYLSLKADLFNPDSIPGIFSTVLAELHTPPTVVIYNAGSFTAPPDADSVLSITAASVVRDLNINTISPYVAAQQAVAGWAATLDSDSDAKKTFIYTGNKTNEQIVPMPMFQNIGMGKSASAYWIGMADATYAAKKYRYVCACALWAFL